MSQPDLAAEGDQVETQSNAPSNNSRIQVEESFFEDSDSAYFDESECSTRSVRSSIYDYESSHGRTFHAYHAGKYALPNDEEENDRCDIMYHAMRLAVGNQLFFAPVDEPRSVLDIGTGTGIWAIDVADTYPACEVIGTDLSPIQPNYIPPNLQFEIADADEEWTWRPRFDLVHTRIMNDTSLKDWGRFYEQAFTALKPGGWVESQEFSYIRRSDDNSIPADSQIAKWEAYWTEGINKIGLSGPADPDLMERQMAAAGFVNITCRPFKLPIGPWPKDKALKQAGAFGYVNLHDGFQSLSIKIFTHFLGWSVEELEVFLVDCRKELKRKNVHAYWPIWVLYGQKPDYSKDLHADLHEDIHEDLHADEFHAQ